HRESEGDPQLKGRIRAMQRQAAQRRMMADVPKADVIVTNPTHYAVALRYSEQEGGAPRVLAKGADMVAAKIRELGAEHKIPMLEAPPLARALYRHTEIGHQIPTALYAAVAEVLAYVYQLRRVRTHGGRAPVRPTDLPVPADMDPGPQPGPDDEPDAA
ncbi:EscU/YscU/HrcU family type III secretion system export apparatus switch protein, partial [Ralstonia solanacearum]